MDHDHGFSEKDFDIIARFQSDEDTLIGERILIDKLKPEINLI